MKPSEIRFTHLDKIYWPGLSISKGDLVTYYRSMGELMLPYLKNRPANLLRQPNGIRGKAFYQKDMSGLKLPNWIKTIPVYSQSNQKEISYYVIDSVDSLLYLVQLGCIEINPWSSTTDNLDNPDWAVIDLDPEGVDFPGVVEVALEVKRVCANLAVDCYPKTSGKTGLHVFIPTEGRYSYEQIRQFSELIAHMVHSSTDPLTSLVRDPKSRRNKIYLDYLQNRESQTLAAPYSVRPTIEASVSAPLDWSEVNKKLRPSDFTLKNMPERVKSLGDLWEPVLGQGVDMAQVLDRIT